MMTEQTPPDIPDAWVTAGLEAVIAYHERQRDVAWYTPPSEEVAAIIAGVMPLIAAAEGERIAQLADRTEAVCRGDDGTSRFFAALIREGAHDGC